MVYFIKDRYVYKNNDKNLIDINLMIVIWVFVGFYYIILGKYYDVRDNRGWIVVYEVVYVGNIGCLEFFFR